MRHQERMRNRHDQEWVEELLPNEHHFDSRVFEVKGKEIWNLMKAILTKANVVRVSIWHKEMRLASIPVVYGGVLAAIFPYMSVLSVVSLLALDCKVVVEKSKASN